MGDLAFIQANENAICHLTTQQPLLLTGVDFKKSSILVVISGAIEIMKPGKTLVCAGGDAIVFTDCRPSNLRVSDHSQLALLRFIEPIFDSFTTVCPSGSGALVQKFLRQSRFFYDHDNAVHNSKLLLDAVRRLIESDNVGNLDRTRLSIDTRVKRVLDMIDMSPRHWQFNLTELARTAGASERNLYYLMRAETGMTPYRYYQRSRLVRVREQLVDCRQQAPSISWLATNEGFGHLGRFSALYKLHFGELPSDTLEWVNRIRNSVAIHRQLPAPAPNVGKDSQSSSG